MPLNNDGNVDRGGWDGECVDRYHQMGKVGNQSALSLERAVPQEALSWLEQIRKAEVVEC